MRSETLKKLDEYSKEYKQQLGVYGIRLRIEVDIENSYVERIDPEPEQEETDEDIEDAQPEVTDSQNADTQSEEQVAEQEEAEVIEVQQPSNFNYVERYMILVNDEMFSNELNADEVMNDIVALTETFNIFKNLPARRYEKIIFDRETERIKNELRTWSDKSYDFFPEEVFAEASDDDEYEACPSIRTYIDEIDITDNSIYSFIVHRVFMDENDNITLVGRIQNDTMLGYDDELTTTLGSVLPSDLELIQIPVCDKTNNIIDEMTEEDGEQTEE